jgi:hypothetical protein
MRTAMESATTASLNNKVDLNGSNATFVRIVDVHVSGTEGYITYSNGLHEEWGLFKPASEWYGWVSFVKPYKNTDYNISLGMQGSEPSRYYSPLVTQSSTYPKEKGRFYLAQYNLSASYPTRMVFWRSIGFIS